MEEPFSKCSSHNPTLDIMRHTLVKLTPASSGNPVTSRTTTTRLAKLTKARIASVGYRLSPQHLFPAALLDVLTAWLSLLYQPPGSQYKSIPAESAIFAGDSAGGNLCLSLIQVILQLRRVQRTANPKVVFHGSLVELPMPRGVALLCPWTDLAMDLPSWQENSNIDWLLEIQPIRHKSQPVDDIWPSDPPRGDTYCDSTALYHPLVSPVVASDWTGMPPLWVACGQERCADSIKVVARRAAQQGVPVAFTEYEGMPHIFPIMLRTLPQSQNCYQDWAAACLRFVEDSNNTQITGTVIEQPGDKFRSIDVKHIPVIAFEDAVTRVRIAAKRRLPWIGSSEAKL